MLNNSVLSIKHFDVLTRTVVYRKQNNVHVLNWPICSAYLLPNGVDMRAYKLKDHKTWWGLRKPKGQLRIDKPQTQSTLGTRRRKKREKTNSKEN